jgi:hypothetical protein
MTPKEIFELETIGTHHWGDNDAFWYFVYKEIDEELFRHADAKDETRIVTLCKAKAEESCLKRYNTFEISYWAITFDGKLVGIIVLWGRFGTEHERYITNYPLYQAMIGYVKAMYTPTESSEIIGEEEDIEDLEYHTGWIIDSNEENNIRKEKR